MFAYESENIWTPCNEKLKNVHKYLFLVAGVGWAAKIENFHRIRAEKKGMKKMFVDISESISHKVMHFFPLDAHI